MTSHRFAAALALAALASACGSGEPAAEKAPAPAAPAPSVTPAAEPEPKPAAGPSAAEAALARAEAFLAENAKKEGVTTTKSGLQITALAEGAAGGAAPKPGEWVCVHYKGTLIDGTEFDSSYSRGEPASFPSNRVIAGWVEALALMKPGDKRRLAIHPSLAYGELGAGPDIGPNEALLFDVELLDVLDGPVPDGEDCSTFDDKAAASLAKAKDFLAQNLKKDGVNVTATGLQYRILGSGAADGQRPAAGQFVCVHYKGALIDGTEFDSSYSRGKPAAFPSDRLIQGWVEALAMMRPGDKWALAIPPELAYGRTGKGPIPSNQALLFEVELVRLLDGPTPPDQDCSKG